MADEENKKTPDEYHYPEEYYGGEEPKSTEPLGVADEEEVPQRSMGRPSISRRVFLIFGLIAAILIVYVIITFTTRPKTAEVPQVAPATQAALQVMQPVTTTPVLNNEAQMNIQQQVQNNQQSIAQLQSQIQQLQSEVAQVTSSMSSLANQVQVLANEVRALNMERFIREGKKLIHTPMGRTYYLKALVPGRAWLQSSNGNTITVTIGDRLAGYGIIQVIDTEQGIITTSSGKLIQYGKHDN